jgi:hypothetical protein
VSFGAQRFAVMQGANGKDFAALYALYPTVEHQRFVNWRW